MLTLLKVAGDTTPRMFMRVPRGMDGANAGHKDTS
jgi:hypothetical protein